GAAARPQVARAHRALEQPPRVLGLQLVDFTAGTRDRDSGRGHEATARRRAAGSLLRRMADGGRRYTARNAALKRRMLENPAANATEAIGIVVSSSRVFARCTRRVPATALGEAPA